MDIGDLHFNICASAIKATSVRFVICLSPGSGSSSASTPRHTLYKRAPAPLHSTHTHTNTPPIAEHIAVLLVRLVEFAVCVYRPDGVDLVVESALALATAQGRVTGCFCWEGQVAVSAKAGRGRSE
jgi:hypothetical protein